MKKYYVFLMPLIITLSFAAIAFAGHDHMVIPYEKQAYGVNTTMPIPAGGDLRHHIIGQEPYKNWKTWPGKGEMFKGSEPHGSFLTVYINEQALKSLEMQNGMANNSIIVKENFSPDKKLIAITVMYKVKGYNPEAGDWFWAKYGTDWEIMAEGKVKGCLGCHTSAEKNDFIFTGKVKN